MKILITGIHGFVGSNIVKAMGRNHEIYGLDIVAPEKEGVVKTFSWNDLDENKIPNRCCYPSCRQSTRFEENIGAGGIFQD